MIIDTKTEAEAFYYAINKAISMGCFKGAHDVYTPQSLVEEVLGKINLQGNILGMFNIEFVISLVYTYKVDPEKITFYSDHSNKNKICDRLGVKYITSLDTDMKFDVVVGNPPYDAPIEGANQTKKIWMGFVHTAFRLTKNNGTVALVTPPSWILSNNAVLKKVRNLVLKNNLTHLKLGVQEFFPTVGIQIGYFITKIEPYSGLTEFTDISELPKEIDFRKGIPLKPAEEYRLNLVNKIIKSSNDHYRFILDEAFTKGGYDGQLKLIVNFSKKFWVPSEKSEDNNMPITQNAMTCLQGCVFISSEEEGLKHKSFLSSKAIVWFANNFKRRGQTGFCDAVKRGVIPKFDLKFWTKDEVNQVLNLTDEEIAYIEANS